MLVRTLIGPRAGEVVDIRAHEARQMLEDGRAVLPDQEAPPTVLSVNNVELRTDRAHPRAKQRRRR